MFTPIHRALGAEPGDLTADLVARAVEAGVKETDDLDWKKVVYHSKNPDWQDEAAKDIAAMANSGGGWIVFGVEDNDDTARAISPVQWSGVEEQRLRQVAGAWIGPSVTGLTFTVLDVEGGSVVGMRVPASPDVPHLAKKKGGAFIAPRRNGAHTDLMSERELEQAYRARFRARADREDALESLYGETGRAIGADQGVCFVLVAVPSEPRTDAPAMTESEARVTLEVIDSSPFYQGTSPVTGRTGNYRRGLRRWIARARTDRPWRKTLHEDGTVTVAYRLGEWTNDERAAAYCPVGEPNHCMAKYVEHTVVDGIATVRRTAAELGVEGGYTVRTGLFGQSNKPIYVRTTEGTTNLLLDVDYMEPIYDFHPITVDFDPLDAADDLLPLAREISLDIVNQGGVHHLRAIFDAPPDEGT